MSVGKIIATFAKSLRKPSSKVVTKKFGQEASKFVSEFGLTSHTAEVLGQTIKKTTKKTIEQAYSGGARVAAVITGGIGTVTTLSAIGYGLHEKNRADNAEAKLENHKNVEQQLAAANEELRKRQVELEKVKQEAQEAKKNLKELEEAKKEPVEYTVKKGDCFWNIAKAFLRNEVDHDGLYYEPTNKEIYDLAIKFMRDNNYKLDDKGKYSEPMLYPGDKLKLTV